MLCIFVFYIIGSTLNLISPTAYVPVFWGEQRIYPTYFYLYFEAQNSFFLGNEYIRNCGIFNEAPMYNMALCIALAIELFYEKKTKNCTMYFRCYYNHDILYNGADFFMFFDILRNVEHKK